MFDEQAPAAASTKRDFGYAAMGPRRKRLVGAVVCASLVCLGAGVTAGVLIERSFHGAASASTTASPVPSTTTAMDGSASTSNTTVAVGRRPTIMLLGDVHAQLGSDADGWATRLQAQYVRSLDMVNRGLAEFNTERFVEAALPVVSSELAVAAPAPALITVWFGTIDAALEDGPDALDHVRVERFYDNLVHILRALRKRSPQSKLLVVSPAVVDDDARRAALAESSGEPGRAVDRSNNATAAYATASSEAAVVLRDNGIAFLDLYTHLMAAFPNATARAALFRDGLRFSAEGNCVAFEQVNRRIQTLLPAATLETLQIPTPHTPAVGH